MVCTTDYVIFWISLAVFVSNWFSTSVYPCFSAKFYNYITFQFSDGLVFQRCTKHIRIPNENWYFRKPKGWLFRLHSWVDKIDRLTWCLDNFPTQNTNVLIFQVLPIWHSRLCSCCYWTPQKIDDDRLKTSGGGGRRSVVWKTGTVAGWEGGKKMNCEDEMIMIYFLEHTVDLFQLKDSSINY